MEDFETNIAEDIHSRYFGKHRGYVVDNQDPDNRGRIKVQIPSILGSASTGWALPCLPFAGYNQGLFTLPSIGAAVWIEFEGGDLNFPIWTGGFWANPSDLPEEVSTDPTTATVLKTPGGHFLRFEDDPEKAQISLHHSNGSLLQMDEKGSLELTDANGASLLLNAQDNEITISDTHGNEMTLNSKGTRVKDSHGNQVDMASSGVTVKGQKVIISGQQVLLGGQGGEPVLKGQSFLTLFATHIHPTANGPSGPPIPQGEASALSMKVKAS